METVEIKRNGELTVPEHLLEKVGIKLGEKVKLIPRGRTLIIKPMNRSPKNITKKLAGTLKLKDTKLIDAIIESEDWL